MLWCAHTWLMDCWEHTPRLLVISPEASCGKTSVLKVTEQFVSRPDLSSDLTPAALYSSIDEALEFKGGRPTILFDEFDSVFGNPDDRPNGKRADAPLDQRRSPPQREEVPSGAARR